MSNYGRTTKTPILSEGFSKNSNLFYICFYFAELFFHIIRLLNLLISDFQHFNTINFYNFFICFYNICSI